MDSRSDKIFGTFSTIYEHISRIEKYTEGLDKTGLINSQLHRDAVERALTVIGEAVVRLRNLESDYFIPDAHEIIGFRNHLIHEYEEIDYGVVWNAIQYHLPVLKEVVQGYIGSNPPDGKPLLPE